MPFLPRIREVDDLLQVNAKARKVVREIHPEVCFLGLSGNPMKYNKEKGPGYKERIDVLLRSRPNADREIEEMAVRYRGSGVEHDDVVDAMAAAITAAADPRTLRTLPESPERDSAGLPMEMVYADLSSISLARTGSSGGPMIDQAARTRIEERLRDIAHQNCVRILLAVESGSRAWGYPSPDSDYDVRFLYARPRDWYLSINTRRDVIECPIEDMFDINGWDIRKALGLLLKANPVLSEWLRTPIRYMEDHTCTQRLSDLAARVSFERPARFHYLRLGQSAYNSGPGDRETVALKKYFYAIRPALALRWLRVRPDPPPMDLPGLRAGVGLEPELEVAIEKLLVAKSETAELGSGPRICEIDRFIEEEFAHASGMVDPGASRDPRLLEDANAVFREIIEGGR